MKFIFALLAFTGSLASGQSIKNSIEKYNEREVFHSITMLKDLSIFNKAISRLSYDSTINLYKMPEANTMAIFFSEVDQQLQAMDAEASKEVINEVEAIARVNVMITSINRTYNSDKESPTIEALYLIPATRHLFNKYIINPKAQDWNSLSNAESNDLYKDFIHFLLAQPLAKQKVIILALVETLLTKKLS
ncbi:MAG: hypothetical protein ABL876_03120 [Chitinophagaceae bacterium]